jgi:hypothetical protein
MLSQSWDFLSDDFAGAKVRLRSRHDAGGRDRREGKNGSGKHTAKTGPELLGLMSGGH